MASLINSALSGLNAANAAITVASNNISNVNTPGYSRQTLIQSEAFSTNRGYGYVGNGVSLDTIQRAYNRFLTEQSNSSRSQASFFKAYDERMTDLMNTLGNSSTGFNVSLDSFYASVQDFSLRPTEAAGSMLAAANAMAARMKTISDQLQQSRTGINELISADVSTINRMATDIAALNHKISVSMAGNVNQPPNDLLDQRDELIRNLNDLVGVQVTPQDDHQLNVFMSNGQPLVVGDIASQLGTVVDGNSQNGQRLVLNLPGGNVLNLRESDVSGGELGALISYRNNELANAEARLGEIAISITSLFNQQQQFGINANGDFGPPLFSVGAPIIGGAPHNKGSLPDGTSIEIYESRNLNPSNYRVDYNGSQIKITRLSDGRDVTPPTIPGSGIYEFDGLRLNLTSTAGMVAGDSFNIDTLSQAGASLNVLISDPKKLSPAASMELTAGATNTGTAVLGALRPSGNTTQFDFTTDIKVVFGTGGQYSIYDAAAYDAASGGPLPPPLSTGTVPVPQGGNISYNGWQFDISGRPESGDVFDIKANPGDPSGDNRNAVAFARLSTTPIINGKTLTGAYSELVASIGNRAQEIAVASKAADLTYTQAKTTELSYSGVNLDEEAANLLRYQQAYNAASKLLATSSALFDSFLASIR